MDTGSSPETQVSQADEDLLAKLKQLAKEKADLEADFGLKRAKFKELFIQKEDELKRERERSLASEQKLKKMEEELEGMKDEMDKVRWELEGVKTAAAVSENNKEEEINNIVHNYQQEVATLQRLLTEAAATASNNTAAQYESERNKLVSLNENYEEEIQELRNKLSQEKESFLATVAKSIKRVGAVGIASTNLEHENLEESMRKAQEDSELLKSVVVPLETELKALKSQLEETENKLKRAEDRLRHQDDSQHDSSADRSSPSLPDLDSVTDLNEKVEKLFQYLKAEKAARTDLEMYVAVLSTQKGMLSDEADKIKDELRDVCQLLEEEKQSHESLKQTWQMANDQFLESQRLMMMDLRRMEGVLTTEQQRQIADMKEEKVASDANNNDSSMKRVSSEVDVRPKKKSSSMKRNSSLPVIEEPRHELQQKDLEREAQERKVKALEEKREKQEREHEERRKLSQSKADKAKAEAAKSGDTAQQSMDQARMASPAGDRLTNGIAAGAVGGKAVWKSASSSDISDIRGTGLDEDEEPIFLDSGIHETRSLNEADGTLGEDRLDGLTAVRISPEKVLTLPSLTAAQMKAITDPTPESEAHKFLMATARSSKTGKINLDGKRLVSEKEWALLQEEMRAAREKLGRPCSMCSNYEDQLQKVQEDLNNATSEMAKVERSLTSEQKTNRNLLSYQTELEEALKNAAEDAQSQITHLTNKVMDCEKFVKEYKENMHSTHSQLRDHCALLTQNREQVQKELLQLQAENDSLVDKYSKTAQQLQNEDINLPNNLEEMQLLLLKYREEIISAKVAKEHTEETMRSEIAFLKSQVLGEQQEKNTIEETLTQEISSLQAKVGELENVKKELEQESLTRVESEAKLKKTEASLKSIKVKSDQLVNKMQEKMEEIDRHRSKLEAENHQLRGKVQSLQVDLDNSEAVQRDFVKLSQSLQIQLEKIRQAETEVRWQHEDDIDDCSNCKQPFSVTKRKHHCRHCGRIFCADCTTKSVNSGPNFRPAKVCDVCHTILVKDATPYFSTEPPATPD